MDAGKGSKHKNKQTNKPYTFKLEEVSKVGDSSIRKNVVSKQKPEILA